MTSRATAVTLLVGLSLRWGAARGEEIAPAHQALLLLRSIAYDRSLKDRAGAVVTIAVTLAEGSGAGASRCQDLVEALGDAAKRIKVAELPVRVVTIPYAAAAFESKLAQSQARVLFVCPGLNDWVAAISAITHRRSILSITGTEALVKAGLSIGILARGNKPVLLVNLAAARAEGADLDAALLRIAEVIH